MNSTDYWYKKYLREKARNDKIKKLGWEMYHAAADITNDASHLRKAMTEWWHYINGILKKEEEEQT